MVLQPNFYLLCVVFSEAAKRKGPEVAVYECYAGEGKQGASHFPEYSL
jgi:hypothetical protein